MRRGLHLTLLLMACAGSVVAQAPITASVHRPADSEEHAPSCAHILQSSSSDWIAKSTGPDSTAETTRRAIASYARCYDARTDALAARLAKSGKGPSRSALTEFRTFDAALKNFTATAFADGRAPADALKPAYASLYEKQFRYAFYRSYEPKPAAPAAPTSSVSAPTGIAQNATSQSSVDTDPLTKAKNHFGEILDALPEDRMHSLHAAFATVLGPRAASNETRLAVYRYAIFLLQPPSAQPFSPPPF